MLVAPYNSNNNKHFSSDSRQTNATSLLLKPTGVPVFVTIDQQKQGTNVFSEQSTIESVNEMKLQRTVRATSFVIGKKIQNQTGLDLLGVESSNGVTDKQFPVKIIYQKPSYSQKQYLHKGCAPHELHDNKEEQENDMNSANGNGKVMSIDKSKIHLKQDFPKTNAVSDLNKISEVKHRPKSATTQQLKKDQVKRTKLGPNNTKIKPQVSYIGKVQLKKRPQTAQKSQERVKQMPKKEEDPVSPQATNIPFAHNRFQGAPKSNNMTKELLKKAQEKIKEEKLLIEKQKQDAQTKKEKEKQLQDDVRKMNQEITQIQKEKGVERVDFRKKEEEHKDKQRREENKQERDKRVEMRKKRKEEGRKILGLDIFDEKYVDEKMKKIKEQQLAQQQLDQNNDSTLKKPMVEQQQMFKVKQSRAQSSNPMLFHNKDLKEIIKEEQKAQEEEEEQKVIDKKKLLKEQKQKRKQDQLEKVSRDEQERLKKFQNIQALEDKLRQQKDEYFKKKEFQQKVMEEKERLKKEMEEQPEEKQKKHRKKKSKTENELHKEKIDELKNWIEEQMQREDLKEVSEDEPNQSLVQKEAQQIRMEPLIKVKFDKKEDKQQPNNDINQIKLMKHALPGNHMLAEKEESKLGPRQNRYGVYGDNGYDKIVEIKRQKYEDKTPKQHNQMQNVKEIEVMEQCPQAMDEEDDHQIINIEKEIIEQPTRKIIIDKQAKKSTEESKQRTLKNIEKLFPGVLNVEKELQVQKKEKEQKDIVAAKVIQKWTRGLLGRMFVSNLREKKRAAIEEQYGYFKDQVQFNTDYNLEKFLRDKKKLREKNSIGMSSDIISENIGMDHSGSNKFQASVQVVKEVKVQNYFREPSDKDPLSIISIFAKLHAPMNTHHSNQQKQSQKHKKHLNDSNSDIVEDIYTENFDEDQGSDMGQRRITSNEEIEEDILEGSKGAQSSMGSGGNKHLLQLPNKQNQQIKQGHFNYKPASSIGGSISEDIMVSVEKRSKRSPGGADDSSIAEESHLHLQEMSGSRNSSTTKRQRQYEESIREEVEGSQAIAYEDEAFDSYSGSIAFQKQKQQQQIQGKKEIEKFEIKMKESEGLRKEKLNEMLEEIKKYEQASVSTVVVERMEKIINMSLHQKDKLVLASRLHELEMEKQHKDEINKIREEQIKLMSQLMLMGNQSQMNEQDKKVMLEQINKIIDKPVTIVHQKLQEERKSPQSSDNAFEEKEEQDYIQESRSFKQISNKAKKHDDDDSIQESLPDNVSNNSDDIAEDIPDHTDTDNMSKMSEDEIKESVYADGQKMQDQKKQKEGSNNNELHKMRLTLGSEEAIRKQSKKTFDKSGQGKKENGQSGLFEKSSFEDFTHQKFKELMLDDNNAMFIKEYLEQLEVFQEREHKKKQELKHDLNKQLISPRTYSRKTKELEKWVDEQKSELQDKKIKQVANYQEIGQFLNKLDTDKKIMIQKIGSPRYNKRLMDSNSQASLDYDDIEEDSNESMRVKLARNQIGQISHEMSKHQHKDKKVEAKMATAKKLLADKQKAIDEGIKEKLRDIESEHADQLLNAALKLDINAEIQKRIKGAQRLVEESNQSELDNYDSVRSIEESSKQNNKKHVQFAGSAEKYSPSVYSNMDSSGGPSIRKQPASNRFADSIDESIKIEESYNASQSIQPMSESRKTVSDKRVATSQSAIQESIKESGKYSDDFIEESLLSDKKKSSLRAEQQQFKPNKSEDRFSSNHKIEEDSMDKDIDYSMNFDESIGNSQQLPTGNQQNQSQKVKEMDIVNEESESNQDKSLSQNNRYQSNEEEEEEDIVEESVTSQSMMSSQKNQQLSSMGGQDNQSQSLQQDEEQSEYDKEIVQSSQSVEWKIHLEKPETHRSSHRQTDEDKYSEDFDELEEGEDKDIDNLEDLESCPEEIEQSNDQEKQIDRITEEFMALVLNQIQGDISEIKGLEKADVDQFDHKFPFNLEIQQQKLQQQAKEEKKEEKKQVQDVINVVINKQPIKTNDELTKERYEQQQKQIQESHKAVEQYLDLIIKNIDRKDLINQLEKPIENDPLKILARIQAVEYDESQSFNNLNESLFGQQQFILSLDQFKLIENLYRAKHSDRASLTESGEQRKLTYENFHHKAVFDAFNDALDYERPYKMKGEPNPWSKQTRQIRPKITTGQAEKILEKGKNKVLAWAKTGAGTKCAPLPPPPPISSEFDAPSQQPPQVSEEERRNQVREEKLGELLTKEIEEGDQLWVDYENEDTQTKFDLADMILQDLANEIAAFLTSKLQ